MNLQQKPPLPSTIKFWYCRLLFRVALMASLSFGSFSSSFRVKSFIKHEDCVISSFNVLLTSNTPFKLLQYSKIKHRISLGRSIKFSLSWSSSWALFGIRPRATTTILKIFNTSVKQLLFTWRTSRS